MWLTLIPEGDQTERFPEPAFIPDLISGILNFEL
jgi:hypothetical protein